MSALNFPVLGNPTNDFAIPTLIIGNKNYSTWSLRAWLMLHGFGVNFKEMPIKLFHPSNQTTLQTFTPLGKVPVLLHGDKTVWDSMAIALYAEKYLITGNVWGNNPALAMSLISEMHTGFNALRSQMPMNIKARRKISPTADCLQDLERFEAIVQTCYQRIGQSKGYLLGEFSIVDVFYTPVIFRLKTYAPYSGIALSESTMAYIATVLNHENVKVWQEQAVAETDFVIEDEAGDEITDLGND